MKNFEIVSIDKFQTKQWLKYKHYARRIPPISFAFGLFEGKNMVGVCTFAPPPKAMNDGQSVFDGLKMTVFELNRLVLNDGLDKNAASFFISRCLKLLPKPCCIVSYADATFGHVGYIYQALNFIYTGLNQVHERQWFVDGKEIHSRTLSGLKMTSAEKKEAAGIEKGEYTKKHRYFIFLGSKTEVKKMREAFKYDVFPYPKGETTKYDASFLPVLQTKLFL